MRRLAPIVLFLACSTPIGLPFALTACTPAARQQAAAVASDVARLAPGACIPLSAVGVSATACGQDAAVVSAVAASVAAILSAWPQGRALRAIAMPAQVTYRGVVLTLPADAAAYVVAQLGAGPG